MNPQEIWKNKHQKYFNNGYGDKASIFATEIINFLPKTGKLLDLGAGLGHDSIYFSKNNFNVTSTDFSDFALEIAQNNSRKIGINIDFQNVDLSRPLPYTSLSFDVVYSHLSLHFFNDSDTQKLFNDIHRILKTDGIFATILNTIEDPEVKQSKVLGLGLYETPSGLAKSFFSVSKIKELTKNNFKEIICDNQGQAYKDETKTMIRFVGQKI